jgi:hypothetical protein
MTAGMDRPDDVDFSNGEPTPLSKLDSFNSTGIGVQYRQQSIPKDLCTSLPIQVAFAAVFFQDCYIQFNALGLTGLADIAFAGL